MRGTTTAMRLIQGVGAEQSPAPDEDLHEALQREAGKLRREFRRNGLTYFIAAAVILLLVVVVTTLILQNHEKNSAPATTGNQSVQVIYAPGAQSTSLPVAYLVTSKIGSQSLCTQTHDSATYTCTQLGKPAE